MSREGFRWGPGFLPSIGAQLAEEKGFWHLERRGDNQNNVEGGRLHAQISGCGDFQLGLVLQVEGPDTVKWFRHQAEWASGMCSQREWVTEGAQEGKRRERALRKTKGTVGVLIPSAGICCCQGCTDQFSTKISSEHNNVSFIFTINNCHTISELLTI
jgi:hypothetical protein